MCALTLFAGLGSVALWEPDEPRFAEATRQMLARGDLVTPWFNAAPRFEKPILFYWLQLPFFAVFGPGELAARLPSALAAAASVALTYLIGLRLFGTTAAWLGALALATSFRFVAFARQGLTDVPALLFLLAAMLAFLRLDQLPNDRRVWLVAWGAVGLAALTKGPLAIIPVAVWVSFYALRGEWTALRRMRPVTGALIALAVAAPWTIYMAIVHGRRFLDVAVMSEVVARVRGGVGPSRALLYYFDVWPADLLPWTPFFLAGLAWLAVARQRLDPALRRAAALALVWFAAVVLLFSLSSAKLPHYLLPAHPAAALLTGLFIERTAHGDARRGLWWSAAALVVLMLLAAAALVWAFLRRAGDPAATLAPIVLPALLVMGAVAIVVLARRWGPVAGSLALTATTAAAAAYAALAILPGLAGLQAVPEIGMRIAVAAGPSTRVGQYGSAVSAGLVYYGGRPVELVTSADAAVRFLRAPGDAFLVLPRQGVQEVAALTPSAVHEVSSSSRLVVRLDRLFGDRSPFEDGFVLVSNRPDVAPAAGLSP